MALLATGASASPAAFQLGKPVCLDVPPTRQFWSSGSHDHPDLLLFTPDRRYYLCRPAESGPRFCVECDGLTGVPSDLLVVPDHGAIFVATTDGLFAAVDATHFTRASGITPPLLCLAQVGDALYCVSAGGIYVHLIGTRGWKRDWTPPPGLRCGQVGKDRDTGAVVVQWSGAGKTLYAILHDPPVAASARAQVIQSAMQDHWLSWQVPGATYALTVNAATGQADGMERVTHDGHVRQQVGLPPGEGIQFQTCSEGVLAWTSGFRAGGKDVASVSLLDELALNWQTIPLGASPGDGIQSLAVCGSSVFALTTDGRVFEVAITQGAG
jgi:hypothetical protein